MKYNDLRKCLNLVEVMCENVKIDTANVDVKFVNKELVFVKVECIGAVVEMAISPKGLGNGKN